jgi:ABC-type phosphate transport system substrate-binding protein
MVGSTAFFPTAAIAAVSPDPIRLTPAPCGTHFWSGSSSLASGVDARSGSIPAAGGNIWVAWDDSTTPTVICSYIAVDSTVGQRLFLGQSATGNATLSINAAATSTGGGCLVSFVQDDGANCAVSPIVPGNPLPNAVFTALNGAHFNAGVTDIRAEDGVYAHARAMCNLIPGDDAPKQCMGYGPPGGIGTAILSSYKQNSASLPVAYVASGADPFTLLSIPSFHTISIGAAPILVVVNKTDATAGGFGAINPTNITHTTLSSVFAGLLYFTQDVTGVSTSPNVKPLHVVNREPLSGTYNTFEWQGVKIRGVNTDNSQESNTFPTPSQCFVPPNPATFAPPTVPCGNMLNKIGIGNPALGPLAFHSRTRVIGSGDMINALNSANNPNAIGYNFYSLGAFGGKNNLKYLALDGVDPLYDSYSTNGASPTCSGFFNLGTFACVGTLPNFNNVRNGNYRIWSVIRALVYDSYVAPATGPSVPEFILTGQNQAQVNIPDFVPVHFCTSNPCTASAGPFTESLPVFRAHYTLSGVTGNNGVASGAPAESGGDMAGAAYNRQSERDYFATTGRNLLGIN